MVPNVTVNCTVHLERLDPAMLPQTLKKEVSTSSGKRERDKIYRNDMRKGFLLLRKWVPDIENLNRLGMLMGTVEYIKELKKKIQELQNKINEKETPRESTLQKVMERDTDCTDSAQREPLMPHRSFIDLDTGLSASEMVDGTVAVSTPMEIGASEEIRELVSPDEEEKLLVNPAEEELLASDEEELPEFNNVEALKQWLGL
jgi:hypothetical protein